jgi:hypothetical protein
MSFLLRNGFRRLKKQKHKLLDINPANSYFFVKFNPQILRRTFGTSGSAPENCLYLIERLGLLSEEQKRAKTKTASNQSQFGSFL